MHALKITLVILGGLFAVGGIGALAAVILAKAWPRVEDEPNNALTESEWRRLAQEQHKLYEKNRRR